MVTRQVVLIYMMTKEELIELVERIRTVDFRTEALLHRALLKFEKNVPDPEAMGLIYHHKPRLTSEEVVEKALAYKPIILPPPDDMMGLDQMFFYKFFKSMSN